MSLGSGNLAMDESLRLAERIGRDRRIQWIVIDTEEQKRVRFGLAHSIAEELGGECRHIDGLRASDLIGVVKGL